MRKEIEQMRSSEEGCSQKCRLMNDMLKKDLGRNKEVVNEVLKFNWCNTCQKGVKDVKQVGAVQSMCQSGCGQKLFARCIPLMKDYGDMEKEIEGLRKKIAELTE
jgi:hypothetical protein